MAQHKYTGSGAPATTPAKVGDHYTDIIGKKPYVSVGTSTSADWIKTDGSGGATTFIQLTDVPSSYGSGDGGKLVRVNSAHDGLEFYTAPYLTSLSGAFLLDQTTPQAVINGQPEFEQGILLSKSGTTNAPIHFKSYGSYDNGDWRTFVANGGSLGHDHVLVNGYNCIWNDTAQTWSRPDTSSHAVRYGLESRWTAGDPAVLRGTFENNIDISPYTDHLSFDYRPWFFVFDMDTYKTALSFGENHINAPLSDGFNMGYAGLYSFIFRAGRNMPFVFSSGDVDPSSFSTPNRIAISNSGINASDRAVYIYNVGGVGQSIAIEPGKDNSDVVGNVYIANNRAGNVYLATAGGVTSIGGTEGASRLNVQGTNNGDVLSALRLINKGTADNTAVDIDFQTNTGGSAFGNAIIRAKTTSASGSNSNLEFFTKNGGSYVEPLRLVNSDAALLASAYLNWGSTMGSAGYGLRDNSGVMEFKNSSKIWSPIVGRIEETFSYTAATPHTITHNFGKYPSVTAIDASGYVLIPQTIQHTSTNAVAITFASSADYTIILLA